MDVSYTSARLNAQLSCRLQLSHPAMGQRESSGESPITAVIDLVGTIRHASVRDIPMSFDIFKNAAMSR